MSFKDEFLDSRPKPKTTPVPPVRTELDRAIECSQVLKEDIKKRAEHIDGHYYYFAYCDYNTTYGKLIVDKDTFFTREQQWEYNLPKSAILFHDHLKNILEKEGIIVGNWQICSGFSSDDTRHLWENVDRHTCCRASLRGVEFDPNIPLIKCFKNGRFTLSQNGKKLLTVDNSCCGEAYHSIHSYRRLMFPITFSV